MAQRIIRTGTVLVDGPVSNQCKFCGQWFTPKGSYLERVTCYDCGSYFNTIKGKMWLESYRRDAAAAARSKRLDGVGVESDYLLRKYHTKRSKGRCGMCRRPFAIVGPGELDHKRRVAEGGLNTRSNTWLICRGCHASKTRHENHSQNHVDREV